MSTIVVFFLKSHMTRKIRWDTHLELYYVILFNDPKIEAHIAGYLSHMVYPCRLAKNKECYILWGLKNAFYTMWFLHLCNQLWYWKFVLLLRYPKITRPQRDFSIHTLNRIVRLTSLWKCCSVKNLQSTEWYLP